MSDLKTRLHDLLDPIEQTHLLADVDNWQDFQLESLLREIRHLDLGLLCRMQERIRQIDPVCTTYKPLTEATFQGSEALKVKGKQLMEAGKCACIILAGGQASRLRTQIPKGCTPLSLVRKKSLFQLAAEKVLAASRYVGRPLPVAFMTSTGNRMQTETFFLDNHFFGLHPSQVSFFSQPVWPLLSFSGDLVLKEPGKLAMGPNGNGDLFREFVQNGIYQQWQEAGIEMVRVMPIDNPLALPFDLELFGFHDQQQNDVSIQVTYKKQAEEQVGTLVVKEDKILVVEYGESSAFEQGFANIGLYAFSMPFMHKASEMQLPLHPMMKAVKSIDDASIPAKPNVWKLEEFIFDAFSISDKTQALVYPRERCFAPLKNVEGENSLDCVQQAILSHERHLFQDITGLSIPQDSIFELSSAFYYPTQQLYDKWKGKSLPNETYVEGV